MRITCVYSVDEYTTAPWSQTADASYQKPLFTPTEIPFGLSAIASALKAANHEIRLVVVNPLTPLREIFQKEFQEHDPKLFCLTSVSSQFPAIKKVCQVIKELDPTVFVLVGGSHPTLAPDDAIEPAEIDAICLSEGDDAVVELASQLENKGSCSNIPNLWIKDYKESTNVERTFSIQRNANSPFIQDLDRLPFVDRDLWEPWIHNPREEVSILVGRGCPFKCTYCANHALANLAEGKFVRFRSPENIIEEIDRVSAQYPTVERMYLEVETMGADITLAHDLFAKLAVYNSARKKPLRYWLNLAVHSHFMKHEDKVHAFFAACARAGVTSLNIGLESGSERVRKKVLRRPRYSNEEIVNFSSIAREHGVGLTLYVLMGLPGETLEDYQDTVRTTRRMRPDNVFLSIFAPYPGTDLYNVTKEMGLIPDGVDVSSERFKATLDLPGFSKKRIRMENILFWFKVFRGRWSYLRIIAHTTRSIIKPHPVVWAFYNYLHRTTKFFTWMKGIGSLKLAALRSTTEPKRVNQI